MKITELLFYLTFFLCIAGSGISLAQDAYESDDYTQEAKEELVKGYYRNYDSVAFESRAFNPEALEKLRQDPELRYSYTQAAMTLWDAFWRWVSNQLRGFFQTDGASGNWDQLLLFVLFAAALVYVIIRLLKINTFRILYKDNGKSPIEGIIEHEDIHEMDFEKLLKEATDAKNYRLAIRLYYLWSLKMLADTNHLHWEPGKTNFDYLLELGSSPLKGGFRQLSYYFEYTWYGNFSVTNELFARVNGIFTEWKTRI